MHGGDIYSAARGFSRAPLDWCDFSASINPLGLPQSIKRALLNSLLHICHYPDPKGLALRQALAKGHKVDVEQILLGNGSSELIHVLPRALAVSHGLVIGPTFVEFERALTNAGASCRYVMAEPSQQFVPPAEKIMEKISRLFTSSGRKQSGLPPNGGGGKMVFLCNPNSPTGQTLSRAKVLGLLAAVMDCGGLLVVDETFVDFCERISVIRMAATEESLLVLRSFTKFFAIPGLRIGYVVGTENNIAKIHPLLPPWSVNTFAQVAAVAGLNDEPYRVKSLEFIEKERHRFMRLLRTISGIRVYPSQANFFLLELSSRLSGRVIVEQLKQEGILVRLCENFQGLTAQHLRVAIRKPKENSRLVTLIRSIVKESA